eukprot:ctg_1359.g291
MDAELRMRFRVGAPRRVRRLRSRRIEDVGGSAGGTVDASKWNRLGRSALISGGRSCSPSCSWSTVDRSPVLIFPIWPHCMRYSPPRSRSGGRSGAERHGMGACAGPR